MPDFNKIIQELKDQKKQNVVDNGPVSHQERNRRTMEGFKNLANKSSPNEPKFTGDSDSINNYNNKQVIEDNAQRNYNKKYTPDAEYNAYEPYVDPNAEGVHDLNSNSFGSFGIITLIAGIILVLFIVIRVARKTK